MSEQRLPDDMPDEIRKELMQDMLVYGNCYYISEINYTADTPRIYKWIDPQSVLNKNK
jgi:hypothetical protein